MSAYTVFLFCAHAFHRLGSILGYSHTHHTVRKQQQILLAGAPVGKKAVNNTSLKWIISLSLMGHVQFTHQCFLWAHDLLLFFLSKCTWFNIKTSKTPGNFFQKCYLFVKNPFCFWLLKTKLHRLKKTQIQMLVRILVIIHGQGESVMEMAAQKLGRVAHKSMIIRDTQWAAVFL